MSEHESRQPNHSSLFTAMGVCVLLIVSIGCVATKSGASVSRDEIAQALHQRDEALAQVAAGIKLLHMRLEKLEGKGK